MFHARGPSVPWSPMRTGVYNDSKYQTNSRLENDQTYSLLSHLLIFSTPSFPLISQIYEIKESTLFSPEASMLPFQWYDEIKESNVDITNLRKDGRSFISQSRLLNKSGFWVILFERCFLWFWNELRMCSVSTAVTESIVSVSTSSAPPQYFVKISIKIR
jgi:hypothetical protein